MLYVICDMLYIRYIVIWLDIALCDMLYIRYIGLPELHAEHSDRPIHVDLYYIYKL